MSSYLLVFFILNFVHYVNQASTFHNLRKIETKTHPLNFTTSLSIPKQPGEIMKSCPKDLLDRLDGRPHLYFEETDPQNFTMVTCPLFRQVYPAVCLFSSKEGTCPLILPVIGLCLHPICKLSPCPHTCQSSCRHRTHVNSTWEGGTVHPVLWIGPGNHSKSFIN